MDIQQLIDKLTEFKDAGFKTVNLKVWDINEGGKRPADIHLIPDPERNNLSLSEDVY
jgi:hypothetical protein